jgi:hypothetical protein
MQMSIYRLRLTLSVILSALAVGAACLAVSDPGNVTTTGTPGSTSWELLLNDADVQAELQVTAEQTKKLQQAFKAIRNDVLGKYRNYKAPNAAEAATKASEAMHKIYDDSDDAIVKELTAGQVQRLKQIDRQQRGVLAEGTRKALELTPEQVTKIQKIRDNFDKDYKPLARKFPLDRKSRTAGWQELHKKSVAGQVDVLTDEQRKLWHELTGEAFDQIKFEDSNGIDPKIAVMPPPPPPRPMYRPFYPLPFNT